MKKNILLVLGFVVVFLLGMGISNWMKRDVEKIGSLNKLSANIRLPSGTGVVEFWMLKANDFECLISVNVIEGRMIPSINCKN